MLLYMSNAVFHLAGDGKVCVCVCVNMCVCVCVCVWVLCIFSVVMYSMVCCKLFVQKEELPCLCSSLSDVCTHTQPILCVSVNPNKNPNTSSSSQRVAICMHIGVSVP